MDVSQSNRSTDPGRRVESGPEQDLSMVAGRGKSQVQTRGCGISEAEPVTGEKQKEGSQLGRLHRSEQSFQTEDT